MLAWTLDFLLSFPDIRNLNKCNTWSHTEFPILPTLGAESKHKEVIDIIYFYKILLPCLMDTLDHNYYLFLLFGKPQV